MHAYGVMANMVYHPLRSPIRTTATDRHAPLGAACETFIREQDENGPLPIQGSKVRVLVTQGISWRTGLFS